MNTRAGLTPWPTVFAERYRAEGLWQGRSLGEVFVEAAGRHADGVALVDDEVTLTYADLLDRADACAARLLDLGIAPDDRVVVQLPNHWTFVVLTLACLRAGVVPVMALPAHREHELRHLVEASEAVALVSPDTLRDFDHRRLSCALRETSPTLRHVIVLADADAALPDDVERLLPLCASSDESTRGRTLPTPDADSVAVFLLSGGTTGLPKLIARTHDDYLCNIVLTSPPTAIGADTVYLATLPMGHNFPLACPGILGTLFAGGTVVPLGSPRPERAFAAIRQHGVTHTAAVPAVVASWLDHAGAVGVDALRTLRVLQVGGARLADELAERAVRDLPGTLQQVFGMAEGLINVTRLDDPVEAIVSTQGRPVSVHDELRVVDEATGMPVPDGEPGVLLTRGPYTPRGYYDAPEANARSFTPDGFYITGDIVRLRPDGNLVVEGRSKDMINRGGENISAEEVENLVYGLTSVRLAAAVAMPHDTLGETVCLFAVLHDGHELDLGTVRAHFDASGVAAFKRPDHLVTVDELPLTKVGKIDKKALREMLAAELTASGKVP
ncbi:AMP-binding protein [Microbacterium sp. Kw_RZR3]|jgi:2,3-dihydroxybenzoate-AMP ligase|uniref:(2,3-dihydroxybenzoyl)adenylate synthase n=1 Tax=Microbacterium sp. Kw_RZR3 TaxID=3032903 RepID=UPI0023DCD68E|nr:AMP-binding protein [Microbacterium sp. Kw_RZR3]MDF2045558.1 AMP-binding protein [Microbacterium sp. Kw_RZR3]